MENSKTLPNSKAMKTVGWVLSVIPSLFLIFSGVGKFVKFEGMEDGLKSIGWRMDQMNALGAVELLCVVLYLIPQTAVLGAILLAGYMGGAIATHARVGEPFLIQAAIGVVFWLGLWLREPRLRELIPLRK